MAKKLSTYIKCTKCNTFNSNSDYCKNCGQLINYKLQREIIATKKKDEAVAIELHKLKNPNFVERLKRHNNPIFRVFGWLLFSVWFVISAIGAGLAWFIAMVAAG